MKMIIEDNAGVETKKRGRPSLEGGTNRLAKILDKKNNEIEILKGLIGEDKNIYYTEKNIITIISVLTMFTREWDRFESPLIQKEKLLKRLHGDTYQEYEELKPLISDIFKLYDKIYAEFPERYAKTRENQKSKLGRRKGFAHREIMTPFTNKPASYEIHSGIMFPLVGAFRALINYDKKPSWKSNPIEFFDQNGDGLVAHAIMLLDNNGKSPSRMGKSRLSYLSLQREIK